MTKQQFKLRWESNDDGGGITNDDIANCAVEWGVHSRPRTQPFDRIIYLVLLAAQVSDASSFKPQERSNHP